jgi:chorismate mutase
MKTEGFKMSKFCFLIFSLALFQTSCQINKEVINKEVINYGDLLYNSPTLWGSSIEEGIYVNSISEVVQFLSMGFNTMEWNNYKTYYFYGYKDYSEAIIRFNPNQSDMELSTVISSNSHPDFTLEYSQGEYLRYVGKYDSIGYYYKQPNGDYGYYREYAFEDGRLVYWATYNRTEGENPVPHLVSNRIEQNSQSIKIYYDRSGVLDCDSYYNIPRTELLDIFLEKYIKLICEIVDKMNDKINESNNVDESLLTLIKERTPRELAIFRNCLYAIKGYKFADSTWEEFFNKYLEGYKAEYSDNEVIEMFTDNEKWLLYLILRYENNKLLPDIAYKDKYGNIIQQYDDQQKASCTLYYTPDIEMLKKLKNNIVEITIDNKLLTDISFLKDLTQLKILYILNSNILNLEPVKYLNKLETLSIADGFPGIIDCSIFKNLKELKSLDLNNNEVENIGAINNLQCVSNVYRSKINIKGYNEYNKNQERIDGTNSIKFEYDKYYIPQHSNVRTKPARNSEIITVLNINDEIQILENSEVEEKINDVWGYWYKIKYGNITGYTFGGDIAYETLVTDIDKNGIKDYFHLHYSPHKYINPNRDGIDKDVIIYINNQRISTDILSTAKRSFDKPFEGCMFEEGDGEVLIALSQYGRHDYVYMHIFKVLPDGKIEYIKNWDEIDYW